MADEDLTAHISLSSAFSLLQERSKKSLGPTHPYIITDASYKIQALPSQTKMEASYIIQVFVDKWVDIPLFNDMVSVIDSTIEKQEAFVTTKTKEEVSHVGILGCSKQGVTFSQSGTYLVKATLLVAYTNARENELRTAIPPSSCNKLEITIPGTNLDVKVDSSVCFEKSIQEEKSKEVNGPVSFTLVNCRFSPTTSLRVQWTELVQEETQQLKKVQPLVLTSSLIVLHSIGGGILTSNIGLQWTIRNSAVAMFQVEVDPRVRVVSVKGGGVKDWAISEEFRLKNFKTGTNSVQNPKSTKGRRILKIYLSFAQEDKYECRLMTELNMGGTSGTVNIPVFRCLNVKRELGFIGIEAKTSIEICPLDSHGLNPIDPSELPCNLKHKAMSESSILRAYKYLHPDISLVLNVIRHEDVAVMVALADKVHHQLIFTETGHLITNMNANVKSSQKQFLRVKLPPGSEVWSVGVSAKPVKPSKDSKGNIMIPLQKTQDQNNSNNDFKIDLTYFRSPFDVKSKGIEDSGLQKMGVNGKLKIELASLDLAVSNIFVSVRVPANFEYGDFEGDFRNKECTQFGFGNIALPQRVEWNASAYHKTVKSSNYRKRAKKSKRRGSFNKKSYSKSVGVKSHTTSRGFNKGILSVQVNVHDLEIGSEFKFKDVLLPAHQSWTGEVRYRKVDRKGCCSKRRVDSCTIL